MVLSPTVREYCTANGIVLDIESNTLCVNVAAWSTDPSCDSSVVDAVDRLRDFYDFMDERYSRQTRQHGLACFVEQSLRSSIAAIPQLHALFTDKTSAGWMRELRHSISYDPLRGVVKAEHRLPLIVRSLFADDLETYYKRRIDIVHGKLEKQRLSMEDDIGQAHFECLMSIVQNKAVALTRPPIKAE